MKFLIFILLILINLLLTYGQQSSPIVTITDGKVRGIENQTVGGGKTYFAYRGIPFAKPPLEDLRFFNPVKNEPWTGVLNATEDKSVCVQMVSSLSNSTVRNVIGSEDCLYINVYTTNLNASLPVMVWIYGGGFTTGGSEYSRYGPDYFLDKDVVFVSFNYRLGVFGFISTNDLTCPGNWGLKDQVLALEWVKKNIANFGGDPNKITIFGQSAGSASVSYLVQTNRTRGLFRGAIMESGTALCLWALTRNAREQAFQVGLNLNIFTLSSSTLISRLRQIDYQELKLAENNVTRNLMLTHNILAGLPFGVVEEPPNFGSVLTNKSHELLSQGGFNKVPLIIGFTSNEAGALQHYVDFIRAILFQYDIDQQRLAPYDLTSNIFKKIQAGTRIKNHYFGLGSLGSQPKTLVKFIGWDQFNRPVRETVNQMSKYTNVYYYQFSYKGQLGTPANLTYDGVGHAEELSYIFVKNAESTAKDREIRQNLVDLWTNFVKSGNPTPNDNEDSLQGLKWPSNAPGRNASLTCLNINNTLALQQNPDQVDWEFYQTIYNNLGDPPYSTY